MSLAVHIGFYKTGTTTLQKQVFPKLKNTKFYGFKECIDLFYDVMFIDDLYYDEKKHLDYFQKLSLQQKVLFSQEALSGYNNFLSIINRSIIARRLHKIGFNTLILFIGSILKQVEFYLLKNILITIKRFWKTTLVLINSNTGD